MAPLRRRGLDVLRAHHGWPDRRALALVVAAALAGLLAAAAQALYLARAGGGGARWADVGALPLVAVVGIVANTFVALLSADNSRALCGGPPHAATPATNTARAKAKAAKAKAMKGRKKSSFDAATDALDEIVGDGGMYPSITMVAAAGDVQSFSFNERTAACAPHTEGYAKASPLRRGRDWASPVASPAVTLSVQQSWLQRAMADGSRTPSPRESWLRPNLAAFPSPPAGSPRVDSATAVAEAAADAAAGGGRRFAALTPPPDAAAGALRPHRDRTPSSRELAAFPEPPPPPPVLAAVTPARDAYAGAVPTAMVAADGDGEPGDAAAAARAEHAEPGDPDAAGALAHTQRRSLGDADGAGALAHGQRRAIAAPHGAPDLRSESGVGERDEEPGGRGGEVRRAMMRHDPWVHVWRQRILLLKRNCKRTKILNLQRLRRPPRRPPNDVGARRRGPPPLPRPRDDDIRP